MIVDNSKQTIMIVDDMPENIRVLGELLKKDFYVKATTNGEKALQAAFSNTPPDLILLDVVMPIMNGYEICRKLKENETTKNIPVIFITSKSDDHNEVLGFDVGAVDYITKPFNPKVVRARINTHMELKKYRDALEKSSYIDVLTGLPNRRRFEEVFKSTWNTACREGCAISVIMMDVDNFKQYNDHYGHNEGDICLQEIAKALLENVQRTTDLVCRYGGEEFICILPNTDTKSAVMIAESIRRDIGNLGIVHEYSQADRFVSLSLGIATVIPGNGSENKVLLQEADKALYQSKAEGKNRVSYRILNE